MNDAKLRFSPEEIRLVTDAAWILTKNSVMGKVVGMMAGLSEEYRETWGRQAWPVGIDPGSPKIARGENYKGLPWVMLDYPRVFGKEDVLAIRTMFWWGHAFSITLHLKGRYREYFLPALQEGWSALSDAGFHIGISEDEWRHELDSETYRPMRGEEDMSTGHPFLKLSASLTLDRWEEATEMLRGWFILLVTVLSSCYRCDEKGPSPDSSRVGSDL